MAVGGVAADVVADGTRFGPSLRRVLAQHRHEQINVPIEPQFRRDANGRLRDARGRFLKEGQLAGAAFASGFFRDANGRLRDARGRFAKEGQLAGSGFGDGFRRAIRNIKDWYIPDLSGLVSTVGSAAGSAAKIVAIGSALAGLAAAAAAVANALAPAVGIVAALPLAAGVAAAGIATLKVALSGVGEAFGAALGDDAQEFEESLEGLAPAAQDTARALRALKPQLDALKESVQQEFFAGLDQTLTSVAGTLLGPIRQGMTGAARSVGGLVAALGEVAASSVGVEFIENSFAGFQTIVENLTEPLSNLFSAVMHVGNAIGDAFGDDIGSGLAGLIQTFADFLDEAADSGRAVQWVEGALEVFRLLGGILEPLIGIFASVGDAADKAGGNALGFIGDLLSGVDEFLNSAQGLEFLDGLFDVMRALGSALLPVIRAIGVALGAIAPSIADLLTVLGPGVETLVGALGEGLAALAPALVPLGEALVYLVDAAAPLLPLLGELLGVGVEAIAGIVKALEPLVALGVDLISAVLEPLIPFLDDWADIMVDALMPAMAQLSAALRPLIPFLGELVAELADSLLPLFERWATEVLPDLIPPLVELVGAIVDSLLPALDNLLPAITSLIDRIGTGLLDAIVWLLPAFTKFVEIISGAIGIVGELLSKITSLADAISGLNFGGLDFSALDDLPGLKTGGIVTSPTVAALAEDGRPEVVIPLTRPARARQLVAESGLAQILAPTTTTENRPVSVTVNVNGGDPDDVRRAVERVLADVL